MNETEIVFEIPESFDMPDLADLNAVLTEMLLLSSLVGRSFPEGDVQFLVMTFARTTDTTVRSYRRSQEQFRQAAFDHSIRQYLQAASDMELTVMALNRAV